MVADRPGVEIVNLEAVEQRKLSLSFSPLRGNNQLAHYPILPCLRTVFRTSAP